MNYKQGIRAALCSMLWALIVHTSLRLIIILILAPYCTAKCRPMSMLVGLSLSSLLSYGLTIMRTCQVSEYFIDHSYYTIYKFGPLRLGELLKPTETEIQIIIYTRC